MEEVPSCLTRRRENIHTSITEELRLFSYTWLPIIIKLWMLWFAKRGPEQWWPLISVIFLMFLWILLLTKGEQSVGHTLGPTRLWWFVWKQSDGHWPSRSSWPCNPASSVATYWRGELRTSIKQMGTKACSDTKWDWYVPSHVSFSPKKGRWSQPELVIRPGTVLHLAPWKQTP